MKFSMLQYRYFIYGWSVFPHKCLNVPDLNITGVYCVALEHCSYFNGSNDKFAVFTKKLMTISNFGDF